MEIRYYNEWADSPNGHIFNFALHNCGNCSGFDLFILGLGIAIRA